MTAFDTQPRRDLTLTHATSLVVGITIGTGIFLKAAVMAQAVGTPMLVLAAWVVAGAVAMFGALTFAELRKALLPGAGGEYVYLRAAFGELPGFLYVFNSFLVGGASISAYGAAVAIFISAISIPSARCGTSTRCTSSAPATPCSWGCDRSLRSG